MGLGRGLGVGVGVRVRARARRTVENSVLTAPGEMHVTRTGVPTRSCLAAVVKAVTWLGLGLGIGIGIGLDLGSGLCFRVKAVTAALLAQ